MDKVIVHNLQCSAIIGCNPDEQEHYQPLRLSFELSMDLRKAGQSDCLSDTVNYDALSRRLKVFVEKSRFQLLESLAEQCARLCMAVNGVRAVTLRIEKPQALPDAEYAAVQITLPRSPL